MNPLLASLLLSVGSAVGTSFINNVALRNSIAAAITGTETLIAQITGRGSTSVLEPAFATILQAAIAVVVAEHKLNPDAAAALQKTISDTLAADKAGQTFIDPTTIDAAHAIAPLP